MTDPVKSLQEAIRAAAADALPLRIAGMGSKDFYGGPLTGRPLSTLGLSGIVDYEPTELVVTARAGTPIAALESVLAQGGQMLAFDPPRFDGGGTLGGAVASGLSGPRRAYAGALRDFVLGLQMIDGSGRLLNYGGRVIKNVAGFDVSRLMAGSLGTLGLLTEISLKSLPLPAAELTLTREASEADALRLFNEWAGRPLPLSASCHHAGQLYVRLSGAQAAVSEARQKLGGEVLEGAATFWNGLRDHSAPFFSEAGTLWRVSLPATSPPLQLPGSQLIEWGGALRWLAGDLDAASLRARLAPLGGHLTRFRGGDAAVPAFQPLAPALDAVHRRLKTAFDPAGIFNPGRMSPDY